MRSLSYFAMVLVLGLLGGVAVHGDDKPAEEAKAAIPTLTDDEAQAIVRIVRELDKETRIDVIETPLEDVLNAISKAHKINIAIDPAGLRKAGVAKDKLITLNVKGKSLRELMPILLKPLGLTHLVRPDGLWITSAAPPAGK